MVSCLQLHLSLGHGHRGGPSWCEIYQLCILGIAGARQRQGRCSGHGATCKCRASNKGGHRG
ncbi:hypothetical protein OIU79_022966 [Salix purpurea]|uniref:Uncharacterized protein n=1 Tax=Salix purpurea TaxID=77065 RepID=A0A9Q1ADG4_SALPP|nr:hypothetical protein OIU79_022966 [Salix purpurea]